MKFSTREDINAPIDQVFMALCDFQAFERQAIRRGADVKRLDSLAEPGVGMKWKADFTLRGKQRNLVVELTRFDIPNEMVFSGKSPSIDSTFVIELIALSRTRTRVAIGLEMSPLNLSARLLIQSLKLAKTTLNKRFKLRVAEYAKSLEDRLESAA